ncbi:hypothetical protein FRC09_007686 [Ceratobasidium sp. 395]|nr:hypothetical protein FRC09_007686 [Ceratobasidium sp. 395]
MNNNEYNGFIQQFKAQAQELEDELSAKIPSGKDIEQISLKITKLRTSLTEAVTAGFLPAYDQRLCEQRVFALEESLSRARSASKPKSKFSFKSAANARSPPTKPVIATGQSDPSPNAIPTPAFDTPASSTKGLATEIVLADYTHRYLSLRDATGADTLDDATSAQSLVVTIKNLSNCLVDLTSAVGNINAIHVQGLKRTLLYAGNIQGSILLHDCHECTIIVSPHQFRMHTSDSSHVYLKVTSNPVIEKCTNIGFGPFPIADLTTETISGDFDWMGDSQSPNWHPIGHTNFQLPSFIADGELDIILSAVLPQTPAA